MDETGSVDLDQHERGAREPPAQGAAVPHHYERPSQVGRGHPAASPAFSPPALTLPPRHLT